MYRRHLTLAALANGSMCAFERHLRAYLHDSSEAELRRASKRSTTSWTRCGSCRGRFSTPTPTTLPLMPSHCTFSARHAPPFARPLPTTHTLLLHLQRIIEQCCEMFVQILVLEHRVLMAPTCWLTQFFWLHLVSTRHLLFLGEGIGPDLMCTCASGMQAFAAIQSSVVHLQGVPLSQRFAMVPLGPPLLAYSPTAKVCLAH